MAAAHRRVCSSATAALTTGLDPDRHFAVVEQVHRHAVAGTRLHVAVQRLGDHHRRGGVGRALPPQHKVGDVRKAIDHNGAAAANVAEASEELAEVEALLAQEIEERQRLEREIARRG